MEQIKIENLIKIASAGGGLRLNGHDVDIDDLVNLASAACRGGGELYLSGMDTTNTEDLVRIASACPGRVIFTN